MNLLRARTSRRAFTKMDLLIIAATLVLLFSVVVPYLTRPRLVSSARINCVNNLKMVGLAFRLWAGDNSDRFPSAISTTEGGTMEYNGAGDAYRHFQVMSNELSATTILTCKADNRVPAGAFTTLSNQNLSYFVGLDAEEANPSSILSGDWNLSSNGLPVKTWLVPITTNTVLGWTKKDLHSKQAREPCGNIALGDGSVQQVRSAALAETIRASGGPNRLHLP